MGSLYYLKVFTVEKGKAVLKTEMFVPSQVFNILNDSNCLSSLDINYFGDSNAYHVARASLKIVTEETIKEYPYGSFVLRSDIEEAAHKALDLVECHGRALERADTFKRDLNYCKLSEEEKENVGNTIDYHFCAKEAATVLLGIKGVLDFFAEDDKDSFGIIYDGTFCKEIKNENSGNS